MSSNLYTAMWSYLVFDRYIDTDEAECILSDIEEMAEDAEHAWELLEEII